jgi:hypothetical protein
MFTNCNTQENINRVPAARIGRLAALAVTLLAPVFAGAQNGPVPDYIASMAAFETRRLDGPYAPTNGNISMQSVTPSEWLNNDPSTLGLRGVLAAWSGGGKAVSGTRMFVHGGGHNDSANNGVYIYDFGGQTNPTGWQSPVVISRVSDIRSDAATYADGKPNSVHTYDGVVYASHNNHMYRFGGSRYSSGNFTATAFKHNLSNGQWTQLPNYPGGQSGARTIYDPNTGKIFVTVTNAYDGYFFRTSNDTWSGVKSLGNNYFRWDSMAAWDPSRNRAILVGDGEANVIDVDFAAETISVRTFSPAGATQMYSELGISAVYDPIRDVYWLFGGDISSPGYTSIYEVRASGDPWTTTRYTLTGDSIPRAKDLRGSWGRFVLMPQWGAIGLVASDTSPAFVIKLPDSNVPTPRSPTSLQAN